jgi:hypothetical protein
MSNIDLTVEIPIKDLHAIIEGKRLPIKCSNCQGECSTFFFYESPQDQTGRQVDRKFYEEFEENLDSDNSPFVVEYDCDVCNCIGYTGLSLMEDQS